MAAMRMTVMIMVMVMLVLMMIRRWRRRCGCCCWLWHHVIGPWIKASTILSRDLLVIHFLHVDRSIGPLVAIGCEVLSG